jgi:DNA (cytosine-5)-methyltransferase 1
MEKLTFGSLFAGIGGMDLGLERAGMACRWQVEIDPFCQKVLEKHWPHVRRHGDIRTVDGAELEWVDVIAGGFPCQDISYAGKGAGIDGEQSGLYREMVRIVRLVRPRCVLMENVPALLTRGMGTVLGWLAEIGYDAEWSSLSACSMGAPHSRERLFFVAYPNSERFQALGNERDENDSEMAQRGIGPQYLYPPKIPTGSKEQSAFTSEPSMDRVADGVPDRVDRLKSLGNAVVPHVAEWIGTRIMEAYSWKN